MDRRRFLQSLAACGVAPAAGAVVRPALAQSTIQAGDDIYMPDAAQPGKDVVWLPTPDALIRRMLDIAKVTKDDLVYDLGAGDGRICIAAAQLYGATAVGIEYNTDLAKLAQRNAERAGVADKVEILAGDIFDPRMQERFMRANVITLYLLPELNFRLRPSLLKMPAGTRVVSHAFDMSDWEPDHRFIVEGRDGFYWRVPADVGGRWILRADHGWESTLDIRQRFQRIGGTMTIKGKVQQLLGAQVNGDALAFDFIGDKDTLHTARITVRGRQLDGRIRSPRRSMIIHGARR